jgi:uncharacterized repeat protein (TIGR03803 family)
MKSTAQTLFGLSVVTLATIQSVRAQTFPTYIDLHNFGASVTNANGKKGQDGFTPVAGVVFDSAGNMYGTTSGGGALLYSGTGYGIVWEITNTGIYKDLHDFGGPVTNSNGKAGRDGGEPFCNVSIDSEGNLYGTTTTGGLYDSNLGEGGGIVWEIAKSGVYKDIHDFGGPVSNPAGIDGADPNCGTTFDSSGNMFGTTTYGGANDGGIAWEITKAGQYRVLHDFGGTIVNANGKSGADGNSSLAAVTVDSVGNIIGTTAFGGPTNDSGIVWEIPKGGGYKDLHDFGGTVTNANGKSGPDGESPFAGVTLDPAGNIFGTTVSGGPYLSQIYQTGLGTVWEITKSGVYKDLHDFGGTVTNSNGTTGPDGASPEGNVATDSAGNLYGTTSHGGPYDSTDEGDGGIVWEISKSGTYKDQFDFNFDAGATGNDPFAGVTLDAAGNLFGTGVQGGTTGGGAVFCLSPKPAFTIALPGSDLYGGRQYKATATLAISAVQLNSHISLVSNNPELEVPDIVTVPVGSSTAEFTFFANAVKSASKATVTATMGSQVQELNIQIEPATFSSLSITPNSVVGSSHQSLAGLLTLTSPAPQGGAVVTLKSSDSSALSVPPTFTIPAGYTRDHFPISHHKVTKSTAVTVTATWGPNNNGIVTKTQVVTITP